MPVVLEAVEIAVEENALHVMVAMVAAKLHVNLLAMHVLEAVTHARDVQR